MDLWKYVKTKAKLAGTSDWFYIMSLYFLSGGRQRCPVLILPETNTRYRFYGVDLLTNNWILISERDNETLTELVWELYSICPGKSIREVKTQDSDKTHIVKAVLEVDGIEREVLVYSEEPRSLIKRTPVSYSTSDIEFLEALAYTWGYDIELGSKSREEIIDLLKGEEVEWVRPELIFTV